MNNDAKAVTALPDYMLRVELLDGRIGVFDLKPHLGMPGLAALRDPAYFKSAQILFGAITWPNGEDIAPATLVAEMQQLSARQPA